MYCKHGAPYSHGDMQEIVQRLTRMPLSNRLRARHLETIVVIFRRIVQQPPRVPVLALDSCGLLSKTMDSAGAAPWLDEASAEAETGVLSWELQRPTRACKDAQMRSQHKNRGSKTIAAASAALSMRVLANCMM